MLTGKTKLKVSFKTYLVLSSIIFTAFFLVILSFLLISNTSLQINTKVDAVNRVKAENLAEKIESSLMDSQNRTQYLMTNQQIIQYIKDIELSGKTSYEKNQASVNLTYYLTNMSEFSSAIESIHILTGSSQYESISEKVFSYPLLYEKTEKMLKPAFSDSAAFEHLIREGTPLERKYFFFGDLHEGETVLGKIFAIISDNYMINLVEAPDGYAILNSDCQILINSSPIDNQTIQDASSQLTSSSALNYGSFRLYMKNTEFENLKIIYAADTTQFYNYRKSLIQNVIISLIISLILAMLFSSMISKRILYPLKKLINLIERYKTNKSQEIHFISEQKSSGSLQPRLFLFFIVAIFIPITIFMGSFFINSINTVNSYVKDSYSEIFRKGTEELNEYLDNKRSTLINIANDSYVQKLFEPSKFEEVEPYVLDNLWHQAFMSNEKDWIGIYSSDGDLLLSNGFTYCEEESVDLLLTSTRNSPSGKYLSVSTDKLNNHLLSLGVGIRNISDFLSSEYNIGYVKMDIQPDVLKNKMGDIIYDAESLMIIDKEGRVIYPGKASWTYSSIIKDLRSVGETQTINIDNSKKFVLSGYLSSFDVTLIGIIDYDSLFSQNEFMLNSYILITAIVLLLIFFSSYFISRKVLIPINKVNKIFKETSLDTMHENSLDNYPINEINELGETYNSMIERIENLIDEVIFANESKNRMEQSKKEAEIISLQAQINPHFLYNTLTTINGMINSGYKTKAIEMVNALSDLFRYGISRGEIIIGIQEEMEHAKAYANIMSLRYRDKLIFEWDIDEEAYRYSTIKLIVQPFIENSINHGVKESKKVCSIKIKCEVLEKSIRITVADNGTGIEKKHLELIKNHLKQGNLTGKIGIYNVQSRLLLHYGKEYEINIESEYGQGTTVTILIPKNKQHD